VIILGLSAFYHDSAACLVMDGGIMAAAQEERFSRIKNDASFPEQAIQYCLSAQNLTIDDVDLVAFYEKPFLKFERLLENYLQYAPVGITSFLKAMPVWIKEKIWMKEVIKTKLDYKGEIIFPEHHESHAASAFYPSPFDEAAILALDGVGEWTSTSYGIGSGNSIDLLADIHYPHSLGLLYTAFTYHLGFKVNEGEYKVMGLAPYGEPRYRQQILDHLIDLKEDGSFRLNMDYFNYAAGLTMTNARFDALFNAKPRQQHEELTQHHMDMARSVQDVTEQAICHMASHVTKTTGQKHLCMAGGVALNCVANSKLLRQGAFEDIWIQPAAGDAGGAIGAALSGWYSYANAERQPQNGQDAMKGALLGPSFSRGEIEQALVNKKVSYKEWDDQELLTQTANCINEEHVVGWFQGRMEFGPRALGNRSILGDARSAEMQRIINQKIKFRESFRPFAPAVLREEVSNYFKLDRQSPYMLLVAEVADEKRKALSESDQQTEGLAQLQIERSVIPAVTHVDDSARIQTVDQERNPLFYSLLTTMAHNHNCPLVVNTSFNIKDEPIVCTPHEAIDCFLATNMDVLVIGSFMVRKSEQNT